MNTNGKLKGKKSVPETTKRCQVEMSDGKPCGRELCDGFRCIFHSFDRFKNVELFQKELDEIFKDEASESYDFTRFIFPPEVVFPKKFSKSVTFLNAVFKGKAGFWGASFKGKADFWDASFEGEANFWDASFEGKADFRFATFEGKVHFWDATFKGEAVFADVTFEDTLLLNAERHQKKAFHREVDFRGVKFSKPEKVQFQKVDLSQVRFLETDLRKVHFTDVDWHKEKGRNRVFDEMAPHPDYELVAQLYRWLRANYEENLRYSEAGDFYIGEMEMTRKAQTSFLKKLPLLFYKAISNYGESYYRPLCWLVIFLVVIFPALFMITGLHSINSAESNLPPYVIDYKWDFSSIESFLPNVQKLKDYGTSFLYTMSVFSLVRDKKYTTVNNWGHTLFVAESLLTPVFLAFFLLALRRRFKR